MTATLINGMITALVLSAFLAALYSLLLKINSLGAIDRYRILKIGILLLLIFPMLPINRIFQYKPQINSIIMNSDPQKIIPLTTSNSSKSQPSGHIFLLLISIWTFFITINLLRYLASLQAIKTLKRKSKIVEKYKGIPVLIHDHDTPPSTVGIFEPMILINQDLMSSLPIVEKELVLLHEFIHIRRADFLVNQLGILLKILFCFSPFVHWLVNRLQEEMELSCDEEVRLIYPKQKKRYGEMLLRLAMVTKDSRMSLGYSGVFVSKKIISRRIEAMGHPVLKRSWRLVFGISLVLTSLSLPTIAILAENDLVVSAHPMDRQNIGIKYTVRGFSERHLDFEAIGSLNLVPGMETIVEESNPKLAFSAQIDEEGVKISTKIFDKDTDLLIALHRILIEEGGSARIEFRDDQNGKKTFQIDLQHMRKTAKDDRMTAKAWVPFKEVTTLKDTIKRMAQLLQKNIILPREFIDQKIEVETDYNELEIRQIAAAYRSALNVIGLDLVESNDKNLRIERLENAP